MIYIRRQVNLSMEGVQIFWHVQQHEHPEGNVEEDGVSVCEIYNWWAESWLDALRLASSVVAHDAQHFPQTFPGEWTQVSLDGGRTETWSLRHGCHVCTELRGEAVWTCDPVKHVGWHRARLTGSEREYQIDMEELRQRRNEDMERSMDGRTDYDYMQRIAQLEGSVERLRKGLSA